MYQLLVHGLKSRPPFRIVESRTSHTLKVVHRSGNCQLNVVRNC
jgi:hypothetical protein